jgi:hypothetical protein
MFDMLSGQYKNLASKGRYGDTMLAHINPEEAALLKSMGGAGTINPQTGLREFFGFGGFTIFPQRVEEPLPSLGQALAPESLANLSTQLNTTTVPTEYRGLQGFTPAYEKINPEYSQYADRDYAKVLSGGANIEGYTIPSDQTFQGKPLEAKYDPKGNFQYLTIAGGDYLTPDPNQPNIISAPRINAKGEIIDYGIGDLNANQGGFFSDIISDFGPMILAGLGANYLAGSGLLGAGAAAPAAGGTLAGMGTGAAGAATTSLITGTPLAALTAGGATTAGLAAGGGSAGGLAGMGTGAGGVTQTSLMTGLSPSTLGVTGLTSAIPIPSVPTPPTGGGAVTTPAPPVVTPTGSGSPLSGVTPSAVTSAVTNAATTAATTLPNLSSLGGVGTAIMDFAKANPSIAGSLLGAVTSAIGSANAPTSQTSTTSIDPQIKAEYLANLERAKATAAGLEARQIAQPGAMYSDAESKLYNLGMTPFGAADIEKFYNPYETQVVQGALGDIERTRLMQEQANRDRATAARAFGGSRQAVVSGMTNEAAMRQAANTAAQLRSAGYTQAANLGLQARPMDIAGLQTSLGLGTTRTALEQARLDALRNLGTERLGITSGALGLQPANVGQTSSQPLYNNTAGSLLSGGLTGAYIGSLLGKA